MYVAPFGAISSLLVKEISLLINNILHLLIDYPGSLVEQIYNRFGGVNHIIKRHVKEYDIDLFQTVCRNPKLLLYRRYNKLREGIDEYACVTMGRVLAILSTVADEQT